MLSKALPFHYAITPLLLSPTAVDCGPLLPPVNGDVSLSSTVFGGVATYSCSAGYILVGERTRECQATGWSGEEPVCERKFLLTSTLSRYKIVGGAAKGGAGMGTSNI